MKRALTFLTVLLITTAIFGQAKPLSQAEYVKMLYSLQSSPATKADIITALRTRGIDFAVTDGIRGLTRPKSGNDEESAGRWTRPTPPAKPRVPSCQTRTRPMRSGKDATKYACGSRRHAGFCGQAADTAFHRIRRHGNLHTQDNLVVAVSYRSSGEEDYRLLMINGIIQTNTKRNKVMRRPAEPARLANS